MGEPGARLVLPLLRLAAAGPPPAALPTSPAAPPTPRRLDLDATAASWSAQVRAAEEPCLLIDGDGRVAAMSAACGELLSLDPVATVGVLLLELVVMVDFTAAGAPLAEPEVHAPPVRALSSGRLTRGLVRLREPRTGLTTYDMVGVPLADRAGALAFLSAV